jgi:hypothetical protein
LRQHSYSRAGQKYCGAKNRPHPAPEHKISPNVH